MKNLKRNLVIAALAIIAVFCSACSLPFCSKKIKYKPTGTLKYADMGDYCEVTGISLVFSTDIYIAKEYNKKPVTSIKGGAFRGRASFTSVTIPDTITNIGSEAFSGCNGLTSITIPDSVTTIGLGAFDKCEYLTIYCEAAEKPDGYSIAEEEYDIDWNGSCPVVWNCKKNDVAADGYIYTIVNGVRYALKDGKATVLKQMNLSGNISIPKSVKYKKNSYTVTTIVDGAFYACRELTGITLPDSLTSIGANAFEYCASLTSLTIPSGVTSIGANAFRDCIKLASVNIPDGITSIADGTFAGCVALTSITIPSGVTSIGDRAFATCAFTSITIPSGVTSIGASAFDYCGSLTSITLPDGVSSIGNSTFAGCSALTSISFSNAVTSIGNWAFNGCIALETINFKGTAEDWANILIGNEGNSRLEEVTINYI